MPLFFMFKQLNLLFSIMKTIAKRIAFNTKNIAVLNNTQMTQVKGGMKRFEELKDLVDENGGNGSGLGNGGENGMGNDNAFVDGNAGG